MRGDWCDELILCLRVGVSKRIGSMTIWWHGPQNGALILDYMILPCGRPLSYHIWAPILWISLNPLTVDCRNFSIKYLYLQQSRSWALRKQQFQVRVRIYSMIDREAITHFPKFRNYRSWSQSIHKGPFCLFVHYYQEWKEAPSEELRSGALPLALEANCENHGRVSLVNFCRESAPEQMHDSQAWRLPTKRLETMKTFRERKPTLSHTYSKGWFSLFFTFMPVQLKWSADAAWTSKKWVYILRLHNFTTFHNGSLAASSSPQVVGESVNFIGLSALKWKAE